MEQRLRFAFAAWGLLLAITACGDAFAGDGRYFIEFRARNSTYIGHTYISYFRTDADGNIAEHHETGLVPEEDVWNGVFSPIRASIRKYKDDARLPTVEVYRRQLTADEYARVGRAVQLLRAHQTRWHVVFYNCNDFAIEVAEALGLWRPPSLMPPQAWVRSLRSLNAR
jgi:hypothetical protein